MHDLGRWQWLLKYPQRIECERMVLLGDDFERPVCIGPGHIDLVSPSSFAFQLSVRRARRRQINERFNRLQANPYDGLARFRVQAWDEEGHHWHLGWTIPEFNHTQEGMHVRGDFEGLSADVPSKSQLPSTKTLYRLGGLKQELSGMLRVSGATERASHKFALGQSEVALLFDEAAGLLFASAIHSNTLQPTYTENWLGEPLRILLGQLVYPSLVSRDISDGMSHLYLRKTPWLQHTGGIASYYRHLVTQQGLRDFWRCYEILLEHIAATVGDDGHPNFESNHSTRLVEEIAQAEYLGSRWILAMTLASAVESQAKRLKDTIGYSETSEAQDDRESLIEQIEALTGNPSLKRLAISAIQRSVERTTPKILRSLQKAGTISGDQIAAWNRVRNTVVHGNLTSNYSSKEEDTNILAMATMFHQLTQELVPELKSA